MFDVHRGSTLRQALQKMLATRSHHVWVVDEKRAVKGIISLTDALRVIFRSTSAGLSTGPLGSDDDEIGES